MKPSNPAAFPCGTVITDNGHIARDGDDGMSLRDYFAAAALTGQLMCLGNQAEPHKRAEEAYKFADALLLAREKEGR